MSNSIDRLVTGLLAFGGGFVAGILLAPRSGAETREMLASEAREQLHRLDGQIEGLEKQLATLQDQVRKATGEMTDRVKTAARQGVDRVVPNMPEDEAWNLDDKEVATELRQMPRK